MTLPATRERVAPAAASAAEREHILVEAAVLLLVF